MTDRTSYRPTFYLTITSLFVLFILTVGGVLAWHNYRDTRKIVLTEADQEYLRILSAVTKDFQHTYRSVFKAVHLLSMADVMQAGTLEERLRSLDLLTVSVGNLPEVSGLQVGYANGDYLIVRAANKAWISERFGAPEGAAYIFDHVTMTADGTKTLERIFYGERLTEVGRQPPEPTDYDARTRPWYVRAADTGQLAAVEPYLFFFSKEIGTTVSYQPPGATSVIAADVTLKQLSSTLNSYLLTPGSEIALVTVEGYVLGYSKPDQGAVQQTNEGIKIAHLGEIGSEIFSYIVDQDLLRPGSLDVTVNGNQWHGAAHSLRINEKSGRDLMLVMLSPHEELLADAINMTRTSLLITLAILLVSIPFAFLVAGRISKALTQLSEEADLISRFDFEKPILLRSRIKEVDELARAMDMMKNTISRFLVLVNSLAREQNFDAMLEQITEETLTISAADGALTWFVDEQTDRLSPVAYYRRDQGKASCEGLPSYAIDEDHPLAHAARQARVNHLHLDKNSNEDLHSLFDGLEAEAVSVAAFPLRNRKNEEIGLLCLFSKEDPQRATDESADGRIAFVRTFSRFASVSLESRYLLSMQKRLMDSFMLLLAGAIDAKSPYTGGHCQRVPVLARMLADAACKDGGVFRDYQLDEDGWEALDLAGWLHDCGKVTTPEYVVDKATKLETINDRIHEIRTRFEVLKRDAEIRYWEQVAQGGNQAALREVMLAEQRDLDADFAFVAECNIGDNPMSPEKFERLEVIARRHWTRTLDDRIGISWEEEKRKTRTPQSPLPVEEQLLADRIDHLIERDENERLPADNPWGFKLEVPEYRYNLGELYNLKTERGTLTREERYKINDHVVQTIIMLEKLPYPKHLREVPALAGGHHETMDGKGYPKKLNKEQMSVTARMMAIADIFEALTASDRPYKKSKKLSEAIRIMSFFRNDQHIDPDLFALFLTSGVYLEYARQYLEPDQLDDVDIESYL